MSLLARYRATGADLPYGDPRTAHGVGMEGYFWRLTDPATQRVAIALIGVNRGPDGPWTTLGLASETLGGPATLQIGDPSGGEAFGDRLGARNGEHFEGDEHSLRVRLGGDRLDVRLTGLQQWPHRRFGGSSVFQTVPGLNQYWHPWLLGGRATGTGVFDGQEWHFEDAQVYGEKNWGREGFPDRWWWGQAQGFEDPEACVAFAGGKVHAGPLRTTVTGLVVRLPDGRVIRLGNPVTSPVDTTVTDDTWRLRGRGSGWRIEVDGYVPPDRMHVLPVPLPSERRNVAADLESLTGQLTVRVRRGTRTVWVGRTSLAALERGGLEETQAEIRRRGLPADTIAAPPVADWTP